MIVNTVNGRMDGEIHTSVSAAIADYLWEDFKSCVTLNSETCPCFQRRETNGASKEVSQWHSCQNVQLTYSLIRQQHVGEMLHLCRTIWSGAGGEGRREF